MRNDTKSGPSLAGRFAAAIGFYLLALGLALALIAGPAYAWVHNGHFDVWLTITGLVLGYTILVAIFPRRMRFEEPGVRVDATTQPRLAALIDEEAHAAGEEPPSELYVTMEVNAAVTEAGGRGRVLIVGLPLLHLLSERALRSVIGDR